MCDANRVAWEVEFTHQFEDWWKDLDQQQQEYMDAAIQLLQVKGPALGRPLVDTIKTSIHSNMKELRISKGGDLRGEGGRGWHAVTIRN